MVEIEGTYKMLDKCKVVVGVRILPVPTCCIGRASPLPTLTVSLSLYGWAKVRLPCWGLIWVEPPESKYQFEEENKDISTKIVVNNTNIIENMLLHFNLY